MNNKERPQNTVREMLSRNKLKGLRVKLLSEYDDDVIDGLYYAACEAESNIKKKSASVLDDLESDSSISDSERNELELFLGDDAYEAELIRQTSEEMVIIALYKTVEIVIKRMLAVSGLFSENEISQLSRIEKMKELIEGKVVKLEDLPGFGSYDELRCINNCIKHSGLVGNKLAKFPGWAEGDKLDQLWENYQRIKPEVRKFIKNLSIKIIEKL